MTTDISELVAARRAFPVGSRVRGVVSAIPMGPGRSGILVDLAQPPQGWVDVLHLPDDPTDWPPIGTTGLFEVLQHQPGLVRLFPLDAGMRGRRTRFSRWSGTEWAAVARRYPVDAVVTGTVTHVFPSDREYTVAFDDCWSTVEYTDREPMVGWTGPFRVTGLLEWTHRILVAPAT
ncbi:hypothetical protein AWW66_01610 [Micromonospora rosaria]|uniref:Uncharacterized protein n=1 Tax=Micromonospora rosaria TaxID=47874 RepID=A0A136PZM5_9ACTN|nr:hypothetical protein [Micromonospora rosaria]KXK63686.1 hypothetical protein AWW66_01610 [Micromonospora rosaria]